MTSQDTAGFQLSPQQQRLWLLSQSGEGGPYAAQCVVEIEGDLDVELLKDSVQRVVDRHEILRTTFRRQPGIKIPFQVIDDTCTPLWQFVDLTNDEARIEELLRAEANSCFAFENDSPLRLVLIAMASRHLLILTLPAICADSRTMTNLVREVTAFYGEQALPHDQMQYADFSQWQNELLEAEDEEAESGRAFWAKQDVSSMLPLRLPFEGERNQQHESGITSVRIELNNLNHDPQTFLFACWQTLLWRLTGQTEFVVNINSDGRDYEELKGAFGLYAKSLPMTCSFGIDRRFDDVLEETRDSTASAYEWQAYFNPEESGDSGIAFEFFDGPTEENVNGLTFSVVKQQTCIDRFRVKLSCVRSGNSLSAELQYDPALFEPEAAARIARHFETLLASASQAREPRVSELAVLTDAEQRQLLVEFNQTTSAYPQRSVHPRII